MCIVGVLWVCWGCVEGVLRVGGVGCGMVGGNSVCGYIMSCMYNGLQIQLVYTHCIPTPCTHTPSHAGGTTNPRCRIQTKFGQHCVLFGAIQHPGVYTTFVHIMCIYVLCVCIKVQYARYMIHHQHPQQHGNAQINTHMFTATHTHIHPPPPKH